MCLETVAEGAVLVLKKKLFKKKSVFVGMPKRRESYLSEWGSGNMFTQQENAGWLAAAV